MGNESMPINLILHHAPQAVAQIANIVVLESVFLLSPHLPSDTLIVVYPMSNPPHASEDNYISIKEASQQFSVSEQKLRQLCESGAIVAVEKQGQWQMLRSSLERWVAYSAQKND